MRERRVDRIREILNQLGGRARVGAVLERLREREGDDSLHAAAIYVAVRNENDRRIEAGEPPAFVTRREGEAWGFMRLREHTSLKPGTPAAAIEDAILSANESVEKQLRERLARMDWRTFESAFLTLVLERLGFQDVDITQATRDGGVDARVTYKRGIVTAKALVSAKHWNQATVPPEEVRHLRGIKGDEDTGIIVTSGKFSARAREEAQPGQNQRVVFLIDGDQLVDICIRHGIGVQAVELPKLLALDDSLGVDGELTSETADANGDGEEEDDNETAAPALQRLRADMLGDEERGLSVADIADLLSLAENTVRAYLYNEGRLRHMLKRIRGDQELRERALEIVSRRRAEAEEEDDDEGDADNAGMTPRRLREDMLGDSERGLTIQEVAELTGYAVNTVRVYSSNREKRRQLLNLIRGDRELRERALKLVGAKRG